MGSHSRFSKPALLNILTLCFGILLHTVLFQSTALASPLAENSLLPRGLEKRYSGTPAPKDGNGGPDTSDYPSDDEIKAAFIPPGGAFVFFSGLPNPQTNQAPYQFSQTMNGAQILRNAFPKSYVNRRFKPNPERSQEWYQNFLDRVSGIYADKAVEAGNTVYFVGQYDGTVLDCSIWKRIELPTLIAGGITIKLVDYSNFQNVKDYPLPGVLGVRDAADALEKRASGYCFDWPGDGEDANDPDADPLVGIPYYPGNCGVHLQQVILPSLPRSLEPKNTDPIPPVPKKPRQRRLERQPSHLRLPLHDPAQGRQQRARRRGRLLRRAGRPRCQCV